MRRNILGAAGRLRTVQANFADEDEEQQRDYLRGELEVLIEAVPYGERTAFLEGLLDQFPSSGAAPARRRPGADTEATSTGPSPTDANGLVAELTRALPAFSDEQKQALVNLLASTGSSPAAGPVPEQDLKRLRATLQIRGEDELHPERLAELANLLMEFVVKLEPLIVGLWGKVSPRSKVRPSRSIRQTARGFATEETASAAQLSQELTGLLQFVTAIVAGVGHAGDEFASRWSSILSPQAIRTVAEMKKGLWKSRDAKYWEQYCVQAEEHLSHDCIEKEIREAIGRHAESILKGLGRLA